MYIIFTNNNVCGSKYNIIEKQRHNQHLKVVVASVDTIGLGLKPNVCGFSHQDQPSLGGHMVSYPKFLRIIKYFLYYYTSSKAQLQIIQDIATQNNIQIALIFHLLYIYLTPNDVSLGISQLFSVFYLLQYVYRSQA